MGVRQIRFCDISGTERDVQSHELQIDQMRVEIDLADPEYSKLLDLLRPYLDAGRVEASIPDAGQLPVRQAPAGRPSSTSLTREQRQQLRVWAQSRGIDAPSNNRFKRSVVEQWRRETSGEGPADGDDRTGDVDRTGDDHGNGQGDHRDDHHGDHLPGFD